MKNAKICEKTYIMHNINIIRGEWNLSFDT